MTSALALQFSNRLSHEDPYTGSRPFCWKKKNIRDFSDFLGLISNCFNYRYDDHILILKNCISAVHIIFITSFDSHSFIFSLIFVSQFFLSIQYIHFYFIRWELWSASNNLYKRYRNVFSYLLLLLILSEKGANFGFHWLLLSLSLLLLLLLLLLTLHRKVRKPEFK